MPRDRWLLAGSANGMDTNLTNELLEQADTVFPGGVLGRHRYAEDSDHIPVSGTGAHLVDSNGRRFIDYSCGGGSLILGYSHPAIVSAVQRQAAEAMQFVSIRNEPAIRLGQRVAQMVSWVQKVRFTLSGAEAVMMALRLARAYTGRDRILKFDGAYHGNSDYSLWNRSTASGTETTLGDPESAGIPAAIRELVLIAPYNDITTTRQIVEKHWRSLAGIIVEPVQRSYAAHPEFLEGLRQLCDQFGVTLVFDEIVTGFRHALGGAAEVFGVTPDLGAFGKALGGGLPVAAVAGRADIMDHANPHRSGVNDGYTYVTSSQAGNPLAAAAGVATLDELRKPGVLDAMHERAEYLKQGLRELLEKRRGIEAQVVGFGPLWDLAFCGTPITDHRSAQLADKTLLMRFHQGLIRNGIMVRVGGRSYFSTAHDDTDVEKTLHAAESSLGEL
jgi:glutamate-1-semialdehyde 2,1-aminomutase